MMLEFALGLALFLGMHSVRIFAERWRTTTIQRWGPLPWKGFYAVVSLLGLYLLIRGWGQLRLEPVVLWTTPVALKHAASWFTLAAFVLFVAAYVPGNQLKARLHHPMVLGTKAWALGHLLANNTLADLLLFGAFLAWSVWLFIASRRRDRRDQISYAPGRLGPTVLSLGLGLVTWAAFAFWLHAALLGVRPFGGA